MRAPRKGDGWEITDETATMFEIYNLETGQQAMIYQHTFLLLWNDLSDEGFDLCMRAFPAAAREARDKERNE